MHNGPIRDDLYDGSLNGYQKAAQTTAIYPGKGTVWGLVYASLKGFERMRIKRWIKVKKQATGI